MYWPVVSSMKRNEAENEEREVWDWVRQFSVGWSREASLEEGWE